jgi:putative DNA primase/helicase
MRWRRVVVMPNDANHLRKPPDTHSGNLAQLPAALAPLTEHRRWVCWRWALRKKGGGEEKWTKPPFQPGDLQHAKSNDPSTWDTYDRAVRRWRDRDADGIGFMLADADIGAVDLDDCCQRDPTARRTKIDQWARELRAEANGAYCEVTVSGQGLRLIGTAEEERIQRKFRIEDAGADAAVELFRNTERYITVSGLQLGNCQSLSPFDDFLNTVLARFDNQHADHDQRGDDHYADLIRNGAREGERSEGFQAVVWHLAAKGWTIDRIIAELERHPNGIGAKYANRLQQEVTRSYEKWRTRQPVQRQGLPIIKSVPGRIASMVDQAQTALLDSDLPIFVRGKMLVEPITAERQAAHDRTTSVTVFAPLVEKKLAYLLNKHAAVFQRHDQRRKAWVEIDPPENVTVALLTLLTWQFPEVVGIIDAPTMRPDGSIVARFGYDPNTRLWCNSHIELPKIADKPSRAEAKQALRLLTEMLSGFPFVSTVDRAVVLAAILSAVLRGAFDVVPLFAILAHDAGTGKSFLVDLISTIVTGRPCPVFTGSKSVEEMEKRLGTLLLEGAFMTSLDNMACDIKGALLAQMVTQICIKTRILGKSEMPECEWRGMLFATGNNIRVVDDMIRRTLTCNLDAKVERPERRKFDFDPIQRVLKDRAAYIAAAITIARAYMAADQPRATDMTPLAGFDAWSRMVREPLLWLGEDDPVASMETARASDPERVAARELVSRWRTCIGIGEVVSARDIIATAERFAKFRALLIEQAGTPRGDKIDPVRLGKLLQTQHGRVYDNLRIDVVSHRGRSNGYVLREIGGRRIARKGGESAV